MRAVALRLHALARSCALRCHVRLERVAARREVEDYEWRPTFMPCMRLTRLDATRFFGNPNNRLFAAFAARIAVLDQPKRSLRVLRRDAHMLAFQRAVDEAAPGKHLAGPYIVVSPIACS